MFKIIKNQEFNNNNNNTYLSAFINCILIDYMFSLQSLVVEGCCQTSEEIWL